MTGLGHDVLDISGDFLGPKSGQIEVQCGSDLNMIQVKEKLLSSTEWERKIEEELERVEDEHDASQVEVPRQTQLPQRR